MDNKTVLDFVKGKKVLLERFEIQAYGGGYDTVLTFRVGERFSNGVFLHISPPINVFISNIKELVKRMEEVEMKRFLSLFHKGIIEHFQISTPKTATVVLRCTDSLLDSEMSKVFRLELVKNDGL